MKKTIGFHELEYYLGLEFNEISKIVSLAVPEGEQFLEVEVFVYEDDDDVTSPKVRNHRGEPLTHTMRIALVDDSFKYE